MGTSSKKNTYENERQYFSTMDRKATVEQTWYELCPEVMENLVLSMENSVFEVIRGNANTIKY